MTRHPDGSVVTLDGPAGSGKSTTAREVARRLGYRHLDSGAVYRALTFALLDAGRTPEEWPSLSEDDIRGLGVTVRPVGEAFEVRLGNRALTDELRSQAVTANVSALAKLPAVRGALISLQREAGASGRLVTDGRDMGSVVFPDADVKVFLVANLHERARRRLLEQTGREPGPAEVEAEAERIDRRDALDSQRALSPLRRPEGAVDLDTTGLSFAEQVDEIIRLVRDVERGDGTRENG